MGAQALVTDTAACCAVLVGFGEQHMQAAAGCHLLLLRCLLLWLLSSASPWASPSPRARLMEGVPAQPFVPHGLLLRPRVSHIKQPQVGSCAHLAGRAAGWRFSWWWWWGAHRPLQAASISISEIVGHFTS